MNMYGITLLDTMIIPSSSSLFGAQTAEIRISFVFFSVPDPWRFDTDPNLRIRNTDPDPYPALLCTLVTFCYFHDANKK